MNPAALLLAGVPPSGMGLYARETIEAGPWSFVAVNASRADRAAQAAEVHRRGAQLWLYATPEAWRPDTWMASLSAIVTKARELDAVGIIADPESGWRGTDAAALGRALAETAHDVRVCVTSFPEFPSLVSLAAGCGRMVSASPQIYGRTTQDGEVWARWIGHWRDLFGGRVCLSIAGWPADESMNHAEGYRAYLARLPKVGGAIVWDATGAAPHYISDALADYSPGGSLPGTVAAASLSALAAPGVQASIVILALVFGAIIAGKASA